MDKAIRYTLDHSAHPLPQAILTNSSVDIVHIARFWKGQLNSFVLVSHPLYSFLRAVPERTHWLASLVREEGFEVRIGLHSTHPAVTVEVI